MYSVTVHYADTTRILHGQEGQNLLELLRSHQLPVSAACGGKGSCGKCHAELADHSRILTCGTSITRDMEIWLPRFEGGGLTEFSHRSFSPEGRYTGAALDIGTTTLAAALTDRTTGQVLATEATLNPQQVCGADVISRIAACGEGKLALQTRLVREAAAALLGKLMEKTGTEAIDCLTVSANTTMLHIFCGEDPTSIGTAPYTPVFTEMRSYPGTALDLPAGQVYVLPSASGYIGGDVVCGILTLDQDPGPWLLADLGTNGELALHHNGAILCASTAAGPALEGANIECGLGGVPGAVCAVSWENDSLSLKTIDDQPPAGICGSGLVDLVALLVSTGVIDETGCFDEDCAHPLAAGLKDDRFCLTDRIWLSRKDVRQVQLAKAAIHAGITTLCASAGIPPERVQTLYIAGGLGFFLREESALTTGLIPREFAGKLKALGNSSLAGALRCLNTRDRDQACSIAAAARICELNGREDFSENFIDAMSFE